MSKSDRELCNAATPGPWEASQGAPGGAWEIITSSCGDVIALFVYGFRKNRPDVIDEHNARFSAHFNPAKITELLDERDRLREAIQNAPCHYTNLKFGPTECRNPGGCNCWKSKALANETAPGN